MNTVYCMYYDEELDQDVPLQPTLKEAIAFFKSFKWENMNEDSAMKILSLRIIGGEESSLIISQLEKDSWEVSAHSKRRRAYCGPFFKRESQELFFDISKQEVERLITALYQLSIPEFSALLTENNQSLLVES
ncbi:hypothetical protein AAOGI_11850 [Agarivorans albus]